MARSLRTAQGFTLIELIIAVVLFAVVLLSASNLMISFGKFSTRVVKSEASLMGTALGAFEEIVQKITAANEVAIKPDPVLNAVAYPVGCVNGSCIQVRVDPENAPTPSDDTDDTIYAYWQSGNQLFKSVNGAAGSAIAEDIVIYPTTPPSNSLSFSRGGAYLNQITVILEADTKASSGTAAPVGAKEHLETVVTMRARSAN